MAERHHPSRDGWLNPAIPLGYGWLTDPSDSAARAPDRPVSAFRLSHLYREAR
ncbi:hypothetical protein [Microbacterium pseudoresistens]|uniref:hypothetical protein n=1 Tax=Microbacterium pseudoresistens TaxID=640634 RepID=UPI0031ECF5F5